MALDNARTVLPLMTAPPLLTCERVGMIERPTLVIKGANTYPWYSMMAEALARCVPDAQLRTIRAAKHDGPIRYVPVLSDVLMDFMDSH